MKTGKQDAAKKESNAHAHQSKEKKSSSAAAFSHSGSMTFKAKAPEAGGKETPIQLFPFQVTHNDSSISFIARFSGSTVHLYNRAMEEVAYLEIDVRDNEWGMKNIYVHGDDAQGLNLGTLLVYFAAKLAHANGIAKLLVLTPSGQNLWTNNGFTATVREHMPPIIVGTPGEVLAVAEPAVHGIFTIVNYPAPTAKPAPPFKDPRRFDDHDHGPGGIFEL